MICRVFFSGGWPTTGGLGCFVIVRITSRTPRMGFRSRYSSGRRPSKGPVLCPFSFSNPRNNVEYTRSTIWPTASFFNASTNRSCDDIRASPRSQLAKHGISKSNGPSLEIWGLPPFRISGYSTMSRSIRVVSGGVPRARDLRRAARTTSDTGAWSPDAIRVSVSAACRFVSEMLTFFICGIMRINDTMVHKTDDRAAEAIAGVDTTDHLSRRTQIRRTAGPSISLVKHRSLQAGQLNELLNPVAPSRMHCMFMS